LFIRFNNLLFRRLEKSDENYVRKNVEESIASFNSSYSPHPYLGFVLDYGVDNTSNKFGFNGDEIIFKTDKNDYIVGIFGGSVAQGFYSVEKDYFISELKSKLKDKNIKVYSFALGGYKQPQQLLTLEYFLALGYKFDLIINIDGFNEAALPLAENYNENVSTYFPRNWDLYSTQYFDSTVVSLVNKINIIKSTQKYLTRFSGVVVYLPNKIIGLLYNKYQIALNNRIVSLTKTYQARGPQTYMNKSENEIKEDVVNVWYNSSLQMSYIAKSNNVQYLEFLQPNQYLPNSKHFSQEELDKYIKMDTPYASSASIMYPRIVNKVSELRNKGVEIYDLTNLFINEQITIYADDCCHFNEKGYSLLTKSVIQAIGVSLSD
jgi:hypothetical protein